MIVGDEIAGFTMTEVEADRAIAGELELSVTWSSNDHAPTVVRVPVETDDDNAHAEETPKLL